MRTKQVYKNRPSNTLTINVITNEAVIVWMTTSNGRTSTLTQTPTGGIVTIDLTEPNFSAVVQQNQSTIFKVTKATDSQELVPLVHSCGCANNVNETFDQIVVINWLTPNTPLSTLRLNPII